MSEEADPVVINGLQISFETHDRETEAAAKATTSVADFRAEYGRPSDPSLFETWQGTALPKSGPLRRLATQYLHAECGDICQLCDLPIDPTLPVGHPARIQLDHINATTHGGPDTWGNVRVVHGTCNSELGDGRFPLSIDWARRITELWTRKYLGEITQADVMIAIESEYESRK